MKDNRNTKTFRSEIYRGGLKLISIVRKKCLEEQQYQEFTKLYKDDPAKCTLSWDEEQNAFVIDTEFVKKMPCSIRHPT